MKARALELARDVDDPAMRLNVLREYAQASVLRSLHESQAFQALSFVGGTALRFLYDLQRFSEDLDFSVESPPAYNPAPWLAKLETDPLPPDGAITESRVVNRHFLVAFRHHDLPSLMAGKVHALIVRSYPKGRDWYALLWYRSRSPGIEPNLELLQAALDQTEVVGRHDARRWRDVVRSHLARHDVVTLREDVAPFLQHPAEAELLTAEHLGRILEDE